MSRFSIKTATQPWRWYKRQLIRAFRYLFPSPPVPSEAERTFAHIIEIAGKEPAPAVSTRIAFVVPVYNTNPGYLDILLTSVRCQRAGAWELILSDDGSTDEETRAWLDRHAQENDITIVRATANRGIAASTNAGIAVASTEWVGLLDHDDCLAPFAVDRILVALQSAPHCQFLYTDEIITDRNLKPLELFLKPAFDPVMLSGVNYINHLSVYRRARLTAIGGLRDGFEGSQDFDLLLRYTRGLDKQACMHLPYPAYLWRRDGHSYSVLHLDATVRNARRALAEAYIRDGQLPKVCAAINADLHRIQFPQENSAQPLVSVIIPSRDSYAYISRALNGLCYHTDYAKIEIIIIDNGSCDPRVLDLYKTYTAGQVPFNAQIETEPFNFSRAVNKGLKLAKGELVLLLNNDIEVLTPGWLSEMVSCFAYPDVGVVGAKLLYPDDTLQHAGVIVGFGGLAGHWYLNAPKDFPGPLGRLWVRQSMSCVTGACMLVSRQMIDKIGMLDETEFAIAYNDVDLCLRAIESGYRVIWTPFACLRHYESASRGSDESRVNIPRFRREQDNLRKRHATDVYDDFAISPWYSKDKSIPVVTLLSQLPPAR